MKKLQQLIASVVLTLVLSASTFAGDGVIWPMRTEPAPTPAPVVATNNEAEDEGIIVAWRKAHDSGTEVLLSMLQSVLALF